MAVVERFHCSIFLTFKPTTVHCGDNLLGNRTSNHEESSDESESDEEDVSLSSDDEHDSDQGQEEFQAILPYLTVWTWAGNSSEKGGKKSWDVPNFLLEGLSVEIMGIGSHMSP